MNTNEEILDYQRKEREFSETTIGKAFNIFKNRTISAWTLDTEDSFTDKNRKSTKEAHEAAIVAEVEFKRILNKCIYQG